MFKAKTIRQMELLVLSTLQWRMNTVTPFSFLDPIVRRLGLKSDLHCVIFKKCEALFLSAVSGNAKVFIEPHPFGIKQKRNRQC